MIQGLVDDFSKVFEGNQENEEAEGNQEDEEEADLEAGVLEGGVHDTLLVLREVVRVVLRPVHLPPQGRISTDVIPATEEGEKDRESERESLKEILRESGGERGG